MNSSCIGCEHQGYHDEVRGDGFVAMYYCDRRNICRTHLIGGAPLSCFNAGFAPLVAYGSSSSAPVDPNPLNKGVESAVGAKGGSEKPQAFQPGEGASNA